MELAKRYIMTYLLTVSFGIQYTFAVKVRKDTLTYCITRIIIILLGKHPRCARPTKVAIRGRRGYTGLLTGSKLRRVLDTHQRAPLQLPLAHTEIPGKTDKQAIVNSAVRSEPPMMIPGPSLSVTSGC